MKRILIVGAGFIGLEAAAILVKMGKAISVMGNGETVLPRLGCPILSARLAQYHQNEGINFIYKCDLQAIQETDDGVQAIDQQGANYPCDAILAGVGALPNTKLAEFAGLTCDNGIVVDEYAVTSDPDIVAAGDCTNHPNAHYRQRLRLETVHNAVEQGRTAGFTIAGKTRPYRQAPWVWSDQYDLRIQSVGLPDVYGLLLICKHFVRLRQGMTAYVYPVFFMMPSELASDLDGLFARWFPNGYTSSSTLRPAGVSHRRFNLFAIKHYALQSWWIILVYSFLVSSLPGCRQNRFIACFIVNNCPSDSCCLVCQRDCYDIYMFARF